MCPSQHTWRPCLFIQAALVTNTEPLDRTALKYGVLLEADAYSDWADQSPPGGRQYTLSALHCVALC